MKQGEILEFCGGTLGDPPPLAVLLLVQVGSPVLYYTTKRPFFHSLPGGEAGSEKWQLRVEVESGSATARLFQSGH